MTPTEWLRAVEVWAPFPKFQRERAFTEEECITAIAEFLARRFPPEVFCEATVKLAASRCETFPNFYWCCKVLGGRS